MNERRSYMGYRLSIIVFLLLMIMGCQKDSSSSDNNHSDLYMSITTTDNIPNDLKTKISYLSLKDEVVKEIIELPYTAQYPLGVYDKKENSILYIEKDDSGKNDQLYLLDIDSENKVQLTSELFATNYILPNKDGLFTVSIPKKAENTCLNLYKINESEKRIKKVNVQDDYSIFTTNIHPVSNEILLAGFSLKTQREMVLTQEFSTMDWPMYMYKDGELELLDIPRLNTVKGICKNDEKVYYLSDDTLYSLDIASKKTDVITLDSDTTAVSTLIYLDNDYNLYYIRYHEGNKEICKYNVKKGQNKVLYSVDNMKTEINNAIVLTTK